MRFALGQMVMTPGVEDLVVSGAVNPGPLIQRHASGDWGDVDAHDRGVNDAAVLDGSRILSVYKVGPETVWVITEADRSVTTLLLPSEY